MIYSYCMGIRLDQNYQELTCKLRERCPYYTNTDLGKALSEPQNYVELDTYNDKPCKYFKEEWKKTETCETSDGLTDGLMALLKSDS